MLFDKLEIHVKSDVFGGNKDVSSINNNERGVNWDENKLNRSDLSMNRYSCTLQSFVGLSPSTYNIVFYK